MPRFDPFLIFSLFLALRPYLIPSFYFGFFSIAPRFDPFHLFFRFSDIAPKFDPFPLFCVLWYRDQICSLCFDSSSLASHSDSIPSFYYGFSEISLEFDPFVLFQVLRRRTRIQSLRLFRVLRHCAWIRSLHIVA